MYIFTGRLHQPKGENRGYWEVHVIVDARTLLQALLHLERVTQGIQMFGWTLVTNMGVQFFRGEATPKDIPCWDTERMIWSYPDNYSPDLKVGFEQFLRCE